MAKYLKRSATYDANAPLNETDPMISDLENGEGGGGTLQDAITAGSTLTEDVVINNPSNNTTIKSEVNSVFLSAGDSEFVNDAAEVSVSLSTIGLYVQNTGAADSTQVSITPTTATINFGSGAKNIALETEASGSFETVDGKIVTVVNGIITAITPV
jgi:hypothetical protein